MATGTDVVPESEREIVVARIIDAPRALVFDAFTDADRLGEWYGPDGFTTTTHRFEFRPGGVWDFIMHGPDGIDYPNYIEFREIVPPERIVQLHGDYAGDPNAFISTVTFDAHGDRTEVTMRALFKTKQERDDVAERFGAIEGGRQTLGRLAAYVATRVAENMR